MKKLGVIIGCIIMAVSMMGCRTEAAGKAAIISNQKLLGRLLNNVHKPIVLYWEYQNEERGICLEFNYDRQRKIGSGSLKIGEEAVPASFSFHDCQKAGWAKADPFSVTRMQGYTIEDVAEEIDEYREFVEYNTEGKISSYKAHGNYEEMEETLMGDLLVEIAFHYREDGSLYRKDYRHNARVFGTSCSPWTAYYDESQRLVYERFYLTHGGMEIFYIYEDEDDTPEYCLKLDCNLDEVYAELIQYENLSDKYLSKYYSMEDLYDDVKFTNKEEGNLQGFFVSGVCVVDFMDFNTDGVLDLFMVCANEDEETIPLAGDYKIEIWTYKDGYLQQLLMRDCSTSYSTVADDSNCFLNIYETKEGRLYIQLYEESLYRTVYENLYLKDGAVVKDVYVYDGYNYKKNNGMISKEEWDKETTEHHKVILQACLSHTEGLSEDCPKPVFDEMGIGNVEKQTDNVVRALKNGKLCRFEDTPEIPTGYEMLYPKDKGLFVKSEYQSGSYTDILCCTNENGEVETRKEWTIDVGSSYQKIVDCKTNKILYEGEVALDKNGRILEKEDYSDIFLGSLQEGEGTIYFKISTVDGYEVSLQDLVPDKSLKLVIGKDTKEYIVQVLQKEYDYISAKQLSAEPFSNVLGCNGFVLHNNVDGKNYFMDYYTIKGDKLLKLATSFRMSDSYVSTDDFDTRDHYVDIDGDGIRELVCNSMYLADGALHSCIYYYHDGNFYMGDGCDLLEEPYDDRGTGSVMDCYLSDKNVMRIGFWKENIGEYEYREYPLTLDKLKMEKYEPEVEGL